MRLPWIAHNTPCLCCGEIKPTFIRTGALPFCSPCYEYIFGNATILEEKDRYSWWLNIYLYEEWNGINNFERFKDEYNYKYADTTEIEGGE